MVDVYIREWISEKKAESIWWHGAHIVAIRIWCTVHSRLNGESFWPYYLVIP